MHPPTKESNKGDSVSVIWQKPAMSLWEHGKDLSSTDRQERAHSCLPSTAKRGVKTGKEEKRKLNDTEDGLKKRRITRVPRVCEARVYQRQ
ncbi:hypothetical protein TNCV_2043221 [Trichonephila clavipes]|nr:hypothetical protein TNCV_2043221 [Trichonephila clavipes]